MRTLTLGVGERTAAFGLGLLAALTLPGLALGGSTRSAALVLLFLAGWIVLPGVTCLRLFVAERDGLARLALGCALGLVLEGLALLVCRAAGNFAAFYAWPASAVLFAVLARRHARPSTQARASADSWLDGDWPFLVVLVVLLLAVPTRSGDPARGGSGLESDLLFHAGNAAELLRSGPLLDPRVSGLSLNYHLFAHTLHAGASLVTGLPIVELMRNWTMGFHPLVLVLLVFVLARHLARSSAAGVLAALALVLHVDPGRGLTGAELPAAFVFNDYLDLALFHSPSTGCGLALLAAIALVLARWLDADRPPGVRLGVLLGLLALAASLAKGSVMPVALFGSGVAWMLDSLRSRRWRGRWLAALIVEGVAALPGTLYLALGPGSFAGAMFRVAPFAAATSSQAGKSLVLGGALARWLPDALIGPAVTPYWLLGFCGMGGIGACTWLMSGRPSLAGLGPWFLGVAVAGMGAALALLAPGDSELFFAYDAELVLALVAGVGAVALWRRRRWMAFGLGPIVLPFMLAGLVGTGREVLARSSSSDGAPQLWSRWAEGCRWLREHAEADAMLVARHDAVLLSALAERRAFLEKSAYRPEFHAARWRRVGGAWRLGPGPAHLFPEREEALDRALARGDRESLERLRALAGHRGAMYLVCDALRIASGRIMELSIEPAPDHSALDASPLLERCYANEAVAIYRVVP